MPQGSLNWLIACLLVPLKLTVLWRLWRSLLQLPVLGAYLGASVVSSALYVAGKWHWFMLWLVAVVFLEALASFELVRKLSDDMKAEERYSVRLYSLILGIVMVVVGLLIADPAPYPNYPTVLYRYRIACGCFSLGALVPGIGYWAANHGGNG